MTGNSLTQALAAVTLVVALPTSALQAPKKVSFANGTRSACMPFDTTGRLISLRTKVNDHDSLWFALDTGASGAVLDASKVAPLGLVAHGHSHSRGAGGQVEGSQVEGLTVALPGYELRDVQMNTIDLLALSAQAGRPMDGVLGYEVFSNSVVEIDYAHGCVTTYEPTSYKYSGTGVEIPLHFKENLPYVQAKVTLPNGKVLDGEFVLDTGSAGTLTLAPDVVERENILATAGKTISSKAHGVGGAVDIRIGRVEKLELGPFAFVKPTTMFQAPGAGRTSARGTIGNIGSGILNRFTVIFDYSRKRMILEPNPKLRAPFDYDMSGMAIVSSPPDFRQARVSRVMDDSPAAGAGIRPGDEIEKVNGVPVSQIGIPKLRRMLKDENQDLQLDLLRGAEPVKVTLKTRRMI